MCDAPYVDRHIGGKRKVDDLDGAALDRAALALARLAAVLASGAGAVLSHRPAAGLWGIAALAGIDVTVPKQRRPAAGIALHVTVVAPDEITYSDAIPLTTVPRTLFDLATVLRPRQLERAMNEAERKRLTDSLSLRDLLVRYPRRPGTRAIRALLAAREAGVTVTRRLPPPRTNQWIEGFEIDCVWREQRLAVELDSRAFHATSSAFEGDRERDRILQAAGWRSIRVTSRQLDRSRDELERDLRRLLGLAAVTLAA
jgi:hypothetical protein